MNPFMMMFGPMGISFGFGGCGCGVSMPYYGNNDMLTFMNFPIFRNTANDYLLDPRLAMMQTQQSMQYGGGSIFGNTMLPMFNNFPGMGMPMMPGFWNPGQTHTETEEEKKKREAKEAEAKKPEAKKAASLKKVFDNVKKLAEDKKNRLRISEALIEKADKALEKETAKEQLEAMKEVMDSIPVDTLRKTILADDEVKRQLREAGYNFNIQGNKYSLKDDDVQETDITHAKRMTAIKSDIESSMYQYSEFMNLAAQLNSTTILPFLSAWNNKNNEKILELIANNIPTDKDAVKLKSAQENVQKIVRALLEKAQEYEGYPEIQRLQTALSDKLKVFSSDNATISARENAFTKEKVLEISRVFNELYARLRMQEAVKVRNNIKANDDFKALNEVKEGVIDDNMIVEETMKDLDEEGIKNYPKVEDLDPEPVTEEIVENTEIEAEDADEKYAGNPQGLVDEYLVGEKGVLSKVEDSNVYKTIGYNNDENGVKYYTVKDGKLIEVKKTAENKYEAATDAPAVTAKEIVSYDLTLKRISNLLGKSIEEYKGAYTTTTLPFPVFKATGADEFYALIDGKFGKIDKCTGLPEDTTNKKIHVKGTEKTLDQLKAEDLVDVKDEDILSKEKFEADKKAKEEKDVTEVEAKVYASITELDNTALEELDKITGKENDFEETPVKGYFHCKSKDRYYRYNQTTGKLEYLRGVTKIAETGYMIKDGKWLPCTEIISAETYPAGSEELQAAIQEYAKAFAKDLNGITSSEEDIDAKRRLNTFTSFTDAEHIVNFIKGYKAYGGFWSNGGMCKQIATENGFKEGATHTDKESKHYYIKWIAIRMKEVVNKTNFSKRSAEYALLEQIAKGELVSEKVYAQTGGTSPVVSDTERKSIKATAETLDKIIDKIIEAYDEKHN